MKSIAFILLATTICLASCTKEQLRVPETDHPFTFTGLLKKTEVTSYMYGTHTISTESHTYAVRSTTINLDNYVNQNIRIKGVKISGYPVDNGPEYVDVKAVE
jgi:hypothetical protein